jgi:shikimate kinase
VVVSLATTGPAVIATGGGVVLEPENMRVLRRLGTVIYLSASYETLLHRLQARALPAYMDDLQTEFQKIFQHRQSLYRKLSDRILDADQASVVQISEQLYQIYKDK